jgi:hypothetical protein
LAFARLVQAALNVSGTVAQMWLHYQWQNFVTNRDKATVTLS